MFVSACGGVADRQECHQRKDGIVLHRDLKPANVFLDKHCAVAFRAPHVLQTMQSSVILGLLAC